MLEPQNELGVIPDRVNELLTMHGYAPVPSSTARDWAADAPDRTEADGGS